MLAARLPQLRVLRIIAVLLLRCAFAALHGLVGFMKLLHALAGLGLLRGHLLLRRDVGGRGCPYAVGPVGVSLLRLSDHHREGGHPLRADGGADIAVVDGERHDVVLGYAVLSELPDQLPGVGSGDLEDGEAPTLASRVSRMVVERSSSFARLWVARTKDAPNLPSSLSIDS